LGAQQGAPRDGRREAAEVLKACAALGYNGDHVRVPLPPLPQSAKLTGAKGAMELTCLPGIDIGGMFGRHYQWVTDYGKTSGGRCRPLHAGCVKAMFWVCLAVPAKPVTREV